jgi:hypothetical protein
MKPHLQPMSSAPSKASFGLRNVWFHPLNVVVRATVSVTNAVGRQDLAPALTGRRVRRMIVRV